MIFIYNFKKLRVIKIFLDGWNRKNSKIWRAGIKPSSVEIGFSTSSPLPCTIPRFLSKRKVGTNSCDSKVRFVLKSPFEKGLQKGLIGHIHLKRKISHNMKRESFNISQKIMEVFFVQSDDRKDFIRGPKCARRLGLSYFLWESPAIADSPIRFELWRLSVFDARFQKNKLTLRQVRKTSSLISSETVSSKKERVLRKLCIQRRVFVSFFRR